MNEIVMLVVGNLEKVGLGVALFLCAYVANMGLGAWRNVKIEGWSFEWKMIAQSAVKFAVVALSLGVLSMVISVLPAYATYVGIQIEPEAMNTIDSLVIIGSFFTATLRYVGDAIEKLKEILK